MADDTISLGPVTIGFAAEDFGGKAYKQPSWHRELANALYDDVEKILAPRWVFDIGAHYGLTALFSNLRSPSARLVAVEPCPDVQPYLRRNLSENGAADFEIIEAFVGDKASESGSFFVRSDFTSDGRARSPGPAWREVKIPETTIDELTARVTAGEGVYLKISAQGYEDRVFRGGEAFFQRHDNWLARFAFSPGLLRSQGADPLAFLGYLTSRFTVAECLLRTPYGRSTVSEAIRAPLVWGDLPAFLSHVNAQNQPGRGSVDLIVAPRAVRSRLLSREPSDADREIAELKGALRKINEAIGPLQERDLTLDITTVLTCMRGLFVGRRYGLETTDTAALDSAHGHVLLMIAMCELEALKPGRFAGKTLIEIGTTRERMAAQGSTEKLALFTAMLDMRFVTVDMDPKNAARVRPILGALNANSEAVAAKGEDFLGEYKGSLDVVYLDAFDFDHGKHSPERVERYATVLGVDITDEDCWKMHLDCAKSISEKLTPDGLVVIDDTSVVDGVFDRKGYLAIPYLITNGFKVWLKSPNAIALVRK